MTVPTIEHLPPDWAQRLEDSLTELRNLYGQLDALSQRQASLIEQDDIDTLLSLLADRQIVIDAIQRESEVAGVHLRGWDEQSPRVESAQRHRIDELMRVIGQLTSQIADRDGTDQRTLQQRREAVAVELNGVGRARAAVSAYGDPRGRVDAPRFQDREG